MQPGGFGEHKGRCSRAPARRGLCRALCLPAGRWMAWSYLLPPILVVLTGSFYPWKGSEAEGVGLGSLNCLSDLPAVRHPQLPQPAGQQGSGFTAFGADI